MSYQVTPESFATLTSLWKNTRNKLRWPSVFTLPPWLEVWWRSFQPDAEQFLAAVRGEQEVLGIAPLMIEKGRALFAGDADVCDYMDFITVPGREPDFFAAVLDELKRHNVRRLLLEHLRPDSTVMTTLLPLARQRNYRVQCGEDAVSLEVDLPATWEEYLALLNRKQRHELRRKIRRLSEADDVAYHCAEKSSEDIDSGMDTFLKLFSRSEEVKAGFMTPPREKFFRTIARAMAEMNILRIGTLEVEHKATAMILGFVYDDTFYLYNSAYDPDYRHLSVGILSKALCIKENIENGMKKWDFLKGDEIYKHHLGGKAVPLYRCEIEID